MLALKPVFSAADKPAGIRIREMKVTCRRQFGTGEGGLVGSSAVVIIEIIRR